MDECYYCQKEIKPKTKVCPHCGQSYPLGRSFFSHPLVIVAWVVCSAEGIWLTHSFTTMPDWISILLTPAAVALLFVVLWKIGD